MRNQECEKEVFAAAMVIDALIALGYLAYSALMVTFGCVFLSGRQSFVAIFVGVAIFLYASSFGGVFAGISDILHASLEKGEGERR